MYANGAMGGDTDMLSQVRAGAIDFIPLPGAILSTLVPAMSIESMPFAFKDYDSVWAALDGKLGEHVRAKTAKVGLIPMEKVWNNGFRQITSSTRPINTPQDLAGFKLRVLVSPLWTSMFSALGASPDRHQHQRNLLGACRPKWSTARKTRWWWSSPHASTKCRNTAR